eukprot:5695118-Prymnesium_polylepis.1
MGTRAASEDAAASGGATDVCAPARAGSDGSETRQLRPPTPNMILIPCYSSRDLLLMLCVPSRDISHLTNASAVTRGPGRDHEAPSPTPGPARNSTQPPPHRLRN